MTMNLAQLARTDINLLLLFQAVLEEGHVGRAAQRLHLTPSAVSHGLKRLRDLLNDPLFLRTPKGVTPTERALALAAPVAQALEQVAAILDAATPFDPASSKRRFTIGAPDAVLAAFVMPALEMIGADAPQVDFGLIHVLATGRAAGDEPWADALASLDRRAVDVAILPIRTVPPRFSALPLYEDIFVAVARSGHPLGQHPTLDAFCQAEHVLVSMTGDPFGFVDAALAEIGRQRRIALTVPSFMMALAMLAHSDLVAVTPQRLVSRYSGVFGLDAIELPIERQADCMSAVATRAAMMDAGLAWLVNALHRVAGPPLPHHRLGALP